MNFVFFYLKMCIFLYAIIINMLLYVLYTIKQFLLGNFTCIKLILTTCILLEFNHPLKFIIFLHHIPVYCNISLQILNLLQAPFQFTIKGHAQHDVSLFSSSTSKCCYESISVYHGLQSIY